MKLYYIKWMDCIRNLNFVIINASSEKDRDKKFEKWRKENPEIAPDVCWSPRVIEIKDVCYLNKER